MKLPDDFNWIEAPPEAEWEGARLELDGQAILAVQPCRGGWLVTVLMHDPFNPQPNVAVRSVAAGMRWSARWAKGRIHRLRSLAAEARRAASPAQPAVQARGLRAETRHFQEETADA